LIESVTGRKVRVGIAFDVGVIVQNIGTTKAVYDAVVLNKPLYEKVITFRQGHFDDRPTPGSGRLRAFGTSFNSWRYEAGSGKDRHGRPLMDSPPSFGHPGQRRFRESSS
jgi:Na+-translocating ferredoxin:NAD+ oxidoreductase RnfC subunit